MKMKSDPNHPAPDDACAEPSGVSFDTPRSTALATAELAPGESREPHIGPACGKCGDLTLVSPCSRSGCERWVSICQGCPGVVNLFVATDGLCENCRAR